MFVCQSYNMKVREGGEQLDLEVNAITSKRNKKKKIPFLSLSIKPR